MADLNGVQVKTEPVDPLNVVPDPAVIPKEFLISNSVLEESDCEDLEFFNQVEVDSTRKCLENTRLIIKDFETQLDWHLQQYITLRNVFGNKRNDGKRQEMLSISQLTSIITNHPEGNKKFIKRKTNVANGASGRKKRRHNSESDESELSDDDSEDFDEEDSDVEDDPAPKKGRGKKRDTHPVVKEEIEEEYNELVVPKEEVVSDGESGGPTSTVTKPSGRKAKPKAAPKSKKAKVVMEAEDSSNSVFEIKDEDMEREELTEMLQIKLIFDLDEFIVDEDKPIFILKHDNYKDFDFDECKTNNVIITFDNPDQLPEFMFVKTVSKNILNGNIKAVEIGVFDMYNDAKNE